MSSRPSTNSKSNGNIKHAPRAKTAQELEEERINAELDALFDSNSFVTVTAPPKPPKVAPPPVIKKAGTNLVTVKKASKPQNEEFWPIGKPVTIKPPPSNTTHSSILNHPNKDIARSDITKTSKPIAPAVKSAAFQPSALPQVKFAAPLPEDVPTLAQYKANILEAKRRGFKMAASKPAANEVRQSKQPGEFYDDDGYVDENEYSDSEDEEDFQSNKKKRKARDDIAAQMAEIRKLLGHTQEKMALWRARDRNSIEESSFSQTQREERRSRAIAKEEDRREEMELKRQAYLKRERKKAWNKAHNLPSSESDESEDDDKEMEFDF